MSWNPVLNKFIEIKGEYCDKIGIPTYGYKTGYTDKSESCLERWILELRNKHPECVKYKEYEDMFHYLELNQYENLLLIRYARYSNVYDGEVDVSGDDLWDRFDGFYRECRSVVIDVEKDCIALCPFKKFFNVNELEETSVENIQRRIAIAKTVEFSDKLDGSMQSARWYNGRIIMSGSQALDQNKSWRLEDGYRMVEESSGIKTLLKTFPDYTFIFEYISLPDAHVVKYDKKDEELYLIGMRSVDTGIELSYSVVTELARTFDVRTTKIFNKTFDSVMAELDDKSSSEAEGFVINIDGYKVKVKYNDYVFIHKALSKLSSINLIIRSIADDKYDDLLSKLPTAYHKNVKRVASIIFEYISKTEKEIREYYYAAPKMTKKDFMVYINQNVPKSIRGYCIDMYYGKPINVIKSNCSGSPHYKKLKDMGVANYTELFEE